eukprot:TRINITY_DN1293_c0_g1_i2.p1 TRINITY_DN1293_c0_g1~~TRINITY_DN1293_c0_g1_i2.p1  ORF type:complete len:201 (+),score=32.11 TRINITY_DN1293_c0_g1_i2:137-739(+)
MWNVSKIHHRDVSLVNIGLLKEFPNIPKYKECAVPTIEMIGDLMHVHPLGLHLAFLSKGYNSIAFVSDAIMDVEQEIGSRVNYCGRFIELSKNRRVILENTQTLAGSCVNQLQIFFNLITDLNVKIPDASIMLSENPARIAQLNHIGSIKAGKRADILLFSTTTTTTTTTNNDHNDQLKSFPLSLDHVFINGTLFNNESN